MINRADEIRKAHARGWKLTLLTSDKDPKANGKRCLLPAWTTTDVSLDDLLKHIKNPGVKGNIGLRTGVPSGLDVLDIDGDVDEKLFERLCMIATPWVVTSKGKHIYFQHDPRIGALGNKTKLLKTRNMDLRTSGGQAVFPGSKHHCGHVYMWVDGCSPDEVDVAPWPEWLVNDILEWCKPKHPVATHAPYRPPVGGRDSLERCRKYIAQMPPAISGPVDMWISGLP